LEYPGVNNFSRLLFPNTGSTRYWGIAGKTSNANISTDVLSLYNSSNATDAIAMTGDGNVGIGVANPTNKLQIGSMGLLILQPMILLPAMASMQWPFFSQTPPQLVQPLTLYCAQETTVPVIWVSMLYPRRANYK
jgi:hypothetical protein